MVKKIGIITFHRAVNYGAVLQCYALASYLKQKTYNVEVIDYRSPSIESTYKLLQTNNICAFISSLIHAIQRYKSKKIFERFVSKYLPLSQSIVFSPEKIPQYDVIIIGSDQVWNRRITKGFDEVYWGNVCNNQHIISYAASMGTEIVNTKDDYKIISKYLKNFSHISVREASLQKELENLTEKSIKIVLDPTFLLQRYEYEKMAILPSRPNYILYYQMEYNKDSRKRVSEIAKQLNCDVIILGGKKEKYDIKSEYHSVSEVTVEEFLGYIINATCVFASTFHGVAFSLILQKDFYFFANDKIDRAAHLLKSVGASDRIINASHYLHFSKIDYSKISSNIENLRSFSAKFLYEAIENKECQ